MATTLTTPGVLNDSLDSNVDISTAAGLVDCALKFLKGRLTPICVSICLTFHILEPVSSEMASKFFLDPLAFIKRLQGLIQSAQVIPNLEAANLVCDSFAVILEASLHCNHIWHIFKDTNKCSVLFQSLLLGDARQEIRQGVAGSIRGICCTLPT